MRAPKSLLIGLIMAGACARRRAGPRRRSCPISSPVPRPERPTRAATDGLRLSPRRAKRSPTTASYAPGTIVISTAERRLYLVLPGHQAVRYGVGVGRPGFAWGGVQHIAMKREWPTWTPPSQMLRRRPDLPHFMKGGPDNPLGARAMYLGNTLYRIHGSNEPETIGHGRLVRLHPHDQRRC